VALDAREMAPAATSADMYEDDHDASHLGPRSAAIPGEVKGYWAAKERYGKKDISWASLVQPSIVMCRDGVKVSSHMEKALKGKEEYILADAGMKAVFIDPSTGRVWKEGDVYRRPKLAETLERIAQRGEKEFYEGRTAQDLVRDVREAGGVLTMEDLNNYK